MGKVHWGQFDTALALGAVSSDEASSNFSAPGEPGGGVRHPIRTLNKGKNNTLITKQLRRKTIRPLQHKLTLDSCDINIQVI